MKRPGPPPKGKKPYTGTKPAKGLERDPNAGRRKKTGSTGYPRPPEEAAKARAAAAEAQPARPPRDRRETGFETVQKPIPVRGRKAAIAAAAEAPRAPRAPRPAKARPPRPVRETLRVVEDTHAPAPLPPPQKPSRSQRRGETGGAEPRPLPSIAQLQVFLGGARAKVGRNEIARHFGLTSEQRPALRALLASMQEAGIAAPAGTRRPADPEGRPVGRPEGKPTPRRDTRPGARPEGRPEGRHEGRHEALPDMLPVEVFGTDADGEPLARPLNWQGEGRPPLIYMRPEAAGQPALAPGERVLARLKPLGGGKYEGRSFKRLGGPQDAPARILGIVQNGQIVPTDKKQKGHWHMVGSEAREGDIVLAEPAPQGAGRHFGPKPARVTEVLGRMGEAKSVSLICIHAHGIPTEFPAEAVAQAEAARGTALGKRTDLRATPLVTIDGEDARDFDDAVFAEADGSGWRIIVAIADVAHYVRPGTALDLEARRRGNSVYFPDRVVPMLPEALSNGWCSLRPKEDRGCLFVEMRFTADGEKIGHRFGRGLMRSVARLTYEELQAARDEAREPQDLEAGHTARLYGAFEALLGARTRRGTLELDIPERRVVLSPEGEVLGVAPRPRLDSHKLIEEFMVAANVCAAEELERLVQPTMYRIHDRPSDQKLEGLRQFLQQFAINMPPGNQLHPRNFSHVLAMVKGAPHERLVNETVLRSQSQAAYAPDNIGHFGLALARYAHFTSPIRRYADLMIHRALIRGLKLGADGLTEAEATEMPAIADAITGTERRAAAAERDAVDRYLAAFMSSRVGETFSARISGVTRFGMFVAVDETGAQGMVPFSAMPEDRWEEDPATQSLVGRRTGLRFTLGDAVEVALREANAMTGAMQFQLRQGVPRPAGGQGPHRHRGKPVRGRRG